MVSNAGKAAIVAPYPTSDAVLNTGSNESSAPLLNTSLRRRRLRAEAKTINPQPTSKAITDAHIPRTPATVTPPYFRSAR
jgi:hypothetical protein